MSAEVLVAIMNNLRDFSIANEQNWYRIPVSSAEKWLKHRWPPCWLAFYQTKIFGKEAYAIRYDAKVLVIKKVYRSQLFPNEAVNAKTPKRYYQICTEPLKKLPQPILSRRFRRIVFIPTIFEKFVNAVEINDLFDESPLEDRLWAEFKRLEIAAERQEFVKVDNKHYALDFAIYCENGKIDVETDGEAWHVATKAQIEKDKLRDNDLTTQGWRVLRFNTGQLEEKLSEYCLPKITENINNLGGIKEGEFVTRKIDLKRAGGIQLKLFDS